MRRGELGRAADVYAFGMVAFEALTWRMPYPSKRSPQVRVRAAELGRSWCVLIDREGFAGSGGC